MELSNRRRGTIKTLAEVRAERAQQSAETRADIRRGSAEAEIGQRQQEAQDRYTDAVIKAQSGRYKAPVPLEHIKEERRREQGKTYDDIAAERAQRAEEYNHMVDQYNQYRDYQEHVKAGRDRKNPTVEDFGLNKKNELSFDGYVDSWKDFFSDVVDASGKVADAFKSADAWAVSNIPGYGAMTGQRQYVEYPEQKTPAIQNKVTFSRYVDQIEMRPGEKDLLKTAVPQYHHLYSFMEEEEVDYYSYLLSKEGDAAADAWLESIMPELNRREMEPNAKWAVQNPVVSFFNTAGEQLVGGVSGFVGDSLEYLSTGKIDPYSANNYLQNKVRAERGAVQETIPGDFGKAAYGLATSAADMAASLLAGYGISTLAGATGYAGAAAGAGSPLLQTAGNTVPATITKAVMTANAASQGTIAAKERGLSDDQAFALGLLSGGIEMITEHFSIEQLLADPKYATQYILKNVVTEGAEEGAANILNTVADVIVAGDKSEWNTAIQQYMDGGMKPEDAFKAAFMDQVQSLNMDVLGGMALGGVMSGGRAWSTARNEVTTGVANAAKSGLQNVIAKTEPVMPTVQAYSQQAGEDQRSSVKEQLKNSANVLGSMNPVAEYENTDFVFESKQQAAEWALKHFEDAGYRVSRDGFGEIIVDKTRVKKGISYLKTKEDILAFAVVPQVLRDGVKIAEHSNHKGRPYRTVTFAAPVTINSQRGNMAVVVRQEGANYYKVHRLVMPDGAQFTLDAKGDIAETVGGGENAPGLSPTDNVSNTSITQTEPVVNRENVPGVESYAGMQGTAPTYNWRADQVNEGNTAGVVSLSEIVEDIKNQFGLAINKGKLESRKALGEFHRKSEGIRLKTANEVTVLCHEVGHWLDKTFGLSRLPGIQTAIDIFKASTPELAKGYKKSQIAGEAVAEFVRRYMTDRTSAKQDYGPFYEQFVGAVDDATLQKLEAVGNKMNAYMAASEGERMKAAISSTAQNRAMRRRSEGVRRMANRWAKALYRNIFDEAEPLKNLTVAGYHQHYYGKKANVVAEGLLTSDRFVGFNRERAPMRDVNGNVMTDESGQPIYEKSLSQVLAPLVENGKGKANRTTEEDFNLYLVCRRGMELPGIKVFSDPTLDNPSAMARQAAELEAKYPQFREVAEELYRWERNLLYTWGVETGIISMDTFNALGEKYKAYVPLQRHIDPTNGKAKKKSGQVIKSIHGSGLDIIRPTDSIAVNAQKLVSMAHKNAVLQEVAKAADDTEGVAVYAERVRPDMVRNSVSTDALMEALAATGLDEDGRIDFIDNLNDAYGDRLFEWQVSRRQSPNIVTVMQGGRPTYYRINDPGLLSALVDAGPGAARMFLDVMAAINRPFKSLTTGANFIWNLTKNLPADFQTGYVNSTENNPLKYAVQNVKAWMDVLTKNEAYKAFRAAGGGYSSYIGQDTKKVRSVAASLFRTSAGTFRGNLQRMVEGIENFNNAIEAAPRLAEAKRARDNGSDWMAAVFAGDEATTNFSRGGSFTKELDKVLPYTNAAVQGLWRAGKQFKDHPKAFVTKQVVSSLLLVALVHGINHLTGGEEEYKKLSTRTKNNYYCFHVGDGHFVKIAKARQLSVLESLMERAWEAAAEENPDAFYDFDDYIVTTFAPIGSNPFFSTWSDLRANESFSGAAIVPQNMENLPKEEQYDGSTSYIARGIGQLFGLSPMKVDYAINQLTGIVGDVATAIAPEGDWVGVLGGRNLSADNAYSTDALNILYEQREELERQKNSILNPDSGALYAYKAYDAVIGTLSAINKYGKAHDEEERACRMLARDEALAFREEFAEDGDLVRLYDATGDGEIFPFRKFSTEFSYDGEKYTLSPTDTVQMMHDYNDAIADAYEEILAADLIDEQKAASLKRAKDNVYKAVCEKYVALSSGGGDPDAPILTNTAGLSDGEYASFRSEIAAIKKANEGNEEEETSTLVKAYTESLSIAPEQKAALWADSGYMTEKTYDKYTSCGLDRSLAEQFAYRISDIVGDKDEDGKTITGSKKKKECATIDSFCDEQGLDAEVKYRLYEACDYSESTVSDAPWYQRGDRGKDWFDDIWN